MTISSSIPHLNTALTGPLYGLEQHILDHEDDIEDWFKQKWQQYPPPIHTSIDLRNAGFKLAPIDTNLFPAGFNNLNPEFMELCIAACRQGLQRKAPNAKTILLIPENHTRNLFYFESVARLVQIIDEAGFDVRVGSLQKDVKSPRDIFLPSGHALTLYPLQCNDRQLYVENFIPDAIWLNNDLSEGTPKQLEQVLQPIIPPVNAGWQQRSKAMHFQYYQQLSHEFARLLDIDPWLIDPYFELCDNIDFMSREGETCLSRYTEKLLVRIQKKYDQYQVKQEPYVIIKADAGTYGMAVMRITDIDEIRHMNRKQRTRMSTSKGRQTVTRTIIQEGVPTVETWKSASAEPVVYLIDNQIVGGFYRMHKARSATDSLNAPGMEFEPLRFASLCNEPDPSINVDAAPNRFYAYGVIARLALLAAAAELSLLRPIKQGENL